ncbi:histidine--tRNA ligase [Marinoscillum furvescens]|uniref:Histidine--tRNA ligase n=1 Tax=Marinoscillum furvescens DSM 4134 TaxID=1122208 RepID=A0A3D9L3U9_MARFU|nr:histidine--tRNA ligase [Marinoscillum furvescens]RED97944.1 histidyl-tRNA synthetase [Marinoscillum furvescens DSM 4134]
MATSKPSIPKGTRDFGPVQSAKRSYIIDTIRKSFIKYGFSQIETPAMEQLSVLTGKYGDEGDQLLFKILNSGDYLKKTSEQDYQAGSGALLPKIAEKGLRYDLTVPFARFVVQNQNDITFPFKRFQIQPVWRADRPQKGRYREFYQCDADIVGSDSLWNEAELTLMLHEVYANLQYDGFVLKINHRELLMEMARFIGLAGKEMPFCVTIDKLDKIGEEKVNEELIALGADETKLQDVVGLFHSTASASDKVDAFEKLIGKNRGTEEVQQYFEFLSAHSSTPLKVELDLSLARGLSYYTGIIFEVKATDVKIGSITGGGRYDNLTGVFGLKGISGVGISFGLDRIYDVLEEKGLFPDHLTKSVDLLIAHLDEDCFKHGLSLLQKLRSSGIQVEIYPDQAKLKKQFNYADKKAIPHVLVIGTEEIEKQQYGVKNMVSGEQASYTIEQLIQLLS